LKVAVQTPGVVSVINELSIAPSDGSSARASTGRVGSDPRNPLRNRAAVAPVAEDAQPPEKPSLAKRLGSWVGGGESESESESNTGSSPSGVQTVSAEELQREAPEKMPMPQRVKPMDPARVAMSQPMARGPAAPGAPLPMYASANGGGGPAPSRYDQPCLPNYAWPSYAAYPNYAAVTYPKQYSPTAWPYIGPFYPYPQVPMGWRKVTLEWSDGWWFLDFKDQPASCWHK
jgi:hypothetical protein